MGNGTNCYDSDTQASLSLAKSEQRRAKSAAAHFSQEKMRFQSCFMLMTIQPLDFASSYSA